MATEVDSAAGQTPSESPSDAELIAAARTGDSASCAALQDRHRHAAMRLAGILAPGPGEADDLVAETFTTIFAALRDGHGPRLAFRVYLHTTLREIVQAGPEAGSHAGTQPTGQVAPEAEPTGQVAPEAEPAGQVAPEAEPTGQVAPEAEPTPPGAATGELPATAEPGTDERSNESAGTDETQTSDESAWADGTDRSDETVAHTDTAAAHTDKAAMGTSEAAAAGETGEDASEDRDGEPAADAFRRLPERWQVVLWHTEVESESPGDIAPLLGLTDSGVVALAHRAREQFRKARRSTRATEPDDLARLLAAAVLGDTWLAYLGVTEAAMPTRVLATVNAVPRSTVSRARDASRWTGVRSASIKVRDAGIRARNAVIGTRDANIGARNVGIGAGIVAALSIAAVATAALLSGGPSGPLPERPDPPAAGHEEASDAPTSTAPSLTPSAVPSSPSASPSTPRRRDGPAPPPRPRPDRPSPTEGEGGLPLPPILSPDPGHSTVTMTFGAG